MTDFERWAVPEMASAYGDMAAKRVIDEMAKINDEKRRKKEARRLMWDMVMAYAAYFAIIVAIVAFLFAGLPRLFWVSDKYECAKAAQNADVQTKFVDNHFYSWDCYVKVGDTWVPFDKWRGVDNG